MKYSFPEFPFHENTELRRKSGRGILIDAFYSHFVVLQTEQCIEESL